MNIFKKKIKETKEFNCIRYKCKKCNKFIAIMGLPITMSSKLCYCDKPVMQKEIHKIKING